MSRGRYWMLTIPMADWHPSELPDGVAYLKGQGEEGEGGYLHWQLLVVFEETVTLRVCKSKFCNTAHCELTRSIAADAYVWKDDTYIDGTRFELGTKPLRRNSKPDWDAIWELARQGELLAIESAIRIQHYRTLRTIRADYSDPVAYERKVVVYHGPTGTGKSRRAWEEATWSAYPKDPRSKFWDGYRDQKHVVFDEFRGGIDIAHLLRWFDRYPVLVEIKGASTCLVAEKIWITSNLHPSAWYPDLDYVTYQALERRLEIIEIQ
ncbi:MAG: replication associated protein [Arizlama virus AZLM_25947]|nr:MAG: replication associated protein [Arizlama virus]